MNAILALVLLAGVQDPPKAPQNRDEVLKQDIENAVRKLGSEKYTESYVAREELVDLGRRVIPAVVAELSKKDAKPAVKRACCEILGALRDPSKDAVAALVARLKDTDEYGTSIASAAARSLASIGDESCVPALVEALKSRSAETDKLLKVELIRALGLFRAKEGVELLRKALEDKKNASVGEGDDNARLVAAAAADALGLIRAGEAVDELGEKLSDPTTDPASGQALGVHAARALQRILAHEIKKDDGRDGELSGEAEAVARSLEAWKKWWDSASAVRKSAETRERIGKVAAAVEAFKKAQGKYPEILDYLRTKPDYAKDWPKDGYYQGELKDAWSRGFNYRAPGTGADFDVFSYGADGKTWGGGPGADLYNHDLWKAAKKAETRKAIEETVKALEKFKAEQGRYPEKLVDLVARPTAYPVKDWPKDNYLKSRPEDGFSAPLVFRIPGTAGEAFDLVSYGADGAEGGEGPDEELWNHDKRPAKKEEPKKDDKKDGQK
jgi:general secretion pathway protein G